MEAVKQIYSYIKIQLLYIVIKINLKMHKQSMGFSGGAYYAKNVFPTFAKFL